MTAKVTIVMEENNVSVTTLDERGIKSVKNTNIENIQQIFMREQAMETPLLPSQWGVVKYYRKNHFEGYVLTTAPTIRDVESTVGRSYGTPEKMTIPVPPMIWVFEVMTDQNGRKKLTHSMTYALKHELLSIKDAVFHAPYPNIGTDHGICWGNGNLPEVPSSKSIQNLPARFFTQAFNADIASNRVQKFTFLRSLLQEGEEIGTDNAVYHMAEMHYQLEEAPDGATFSYPLATLKKAGTMDVEQIIRNTLPGIFN